MQESIKLATELAARITNKIDGLSFIYFNDPGSKVNHYFLIHSDHKIYDQQVNEVFTKFVDEFTLNYPEVSLQITDDDTTFTRYPALYVIEGGQIIPVK